MPIIEDFVISFLWDKSNETFTDPLMKCAKLDIFTDHLVEVIAKCWPKLLKKILWESHLRAFSLAIESTIVKNYTCIISLKKHTFIASVTMIGKPSNTSCRASSEISLYL